MNKKNIILANEGLNEVADFYKGDTVINIPKYYKYEDDLYTITGIDDFCFMNMPELEVVYIPETVTTIGADIFWGCDNIKKIKYEGTKAQWDKIIKKENWNRYLPIEYSFLDEAKIECREGSTKEELFDFYMKEELQERYQLIRYHFNNVKDFMDAIKQNNNFIRYIHNNVIGRTKRIFEDGKIEHDYLFDLFAKEFRSEYFKIFNAVENHIINTKNFFEMNIDEAIDSVYDFIRNYDYSEIRNKIFNTMYK